VLAADTLKSTPHFAGGFAAAEIGCGLVAKNWLMGMKVRMYGSF
jgi:hypothetical protein